MGEQSRRSSMIRMQILVNFVNKKKEAEIEGNLQRESFQIASKRAI